MFHLLINCFPSNVFSTDLVMFKDTRKRCSKSPEYFQEMGFFYSNLSRCVMVAAITAPLSAQVKLHAGPRHYLFFCSSPTDAEHVRPASAPSKDWVWWSPRREGGRDHSVPQPAPTSPSSPPVATTPTHQPAPQSTVSRGDGWNPKHYRSSSPYPTNWNLSVTGWKGYA